MTTTETTEHAAAPMPPSTPTLDAAAADRLTALLTARAVMRPAQTLLQEMNAAGTPQHRLTALLTVGGAFLALSHKPRRKARLEALFNGLKTPPLTPEARADCDRAGRACRLLRRLLLTGCQKRSEAAS